MEDIFLIVDDDGMTGVVPSLIAGDNIKSISDEIYNFPLSLISPLSTDNNYIRHDKRTGRRETCRTVS